MIIFSFFPLLYILLRYTETTHGFEQRYLRGSVKTVPKHKLKGHQIKAVKCSSLLSCAHSCLAEPTCVSTNFGASEDNQFVCELNNRGVSLLHNEELTFEEGFIFSLYSKISLIDINLKEGCKQMTCLNQGQCYFNQENQKFRCKCFLPWTGESCQTKTDAYYNFTSLGATGRFGPTSNAHYQGTSLQGISVQKGLQTWIVPVTGKYQAELCGASGADNGFYNTRGGRGAKVKGSVHLQKGTQLSVLVGQEATGGGGGGGTFVVFAADGKPLAVAGGGGAAEIVDGDPGQASETGSVNGGSKGKGGKVCVSDAAFQSLVGVGGGGGLLTNGRCYQDGKCNKQCPGNDGGKSFSAGGVGGYNKKAGCGAGGFGGGGNCGGGGGYSGGGAQVDGNSENLDLSGAGGGGSFAPNNNWSLLSGDCPVGNGFVTFKLVSLN